MNPYAQLVDAVAASVTPPRTHPPTELCTAGCVHFGHTAGAPCTNYCSHVCAKDAACVAGCVHAQLERVEGYADSEVSVCAGSGVVHVCSNARGLVPCELSRFHERSCTHYCWVSRCTVADSRQRSAFSETQTQDSFFSLFTPGSREAPDALARSWSVRRLRRRNSKQAQAPVVVVAPLPTPLRDSAQHEHMHRLATDFVADREKRKRTAVEEVCYEVTNLMVRGRIRRAFDNEARSKALGRFIKSGAPTVVDYLAIAVQNDSVTHYMDVGLLSEPNLERVVSDDVVERYAGEAARLYALFSRMPVFDHVHYSPLPHAVEYLYARASGVLAAGCTHWILPPASELAFMLPDHDAVTRFSTM